MRKIFSALKDVPGFAYGKKDLELLKHPPRPDVTNGHIKDVKIYTLKGNSHGINGLLNKVVGGK